MTNKKKAVIAISAVLAFIILAVCITIPCLYENGLLGDIHPIKKAKDGQVRVACVGDSLTYGLGVEHWTKNNYPARLGGMFGGGYCVNNFGYSGRTASPEGDRPYIAEKLYKDSLSFAPEIVVIMLGSNDSKDGNWKGKDKYIEDYVNIINSYLALDSVREVYIMTPSPVWTVKGKEPYGISPEVISDQIVPAVEEIAERLNLKLIDLYGIFEDKPHLFKDGAHPNAEGAGMIASAVYDAITA